jgi:hypothetical protein
MITDAARKRILVLSDNHGLSRAIRLNLDGCMDLEIVRFRLDSQDKQVVQAGNGDFDLLVVAMSSPTSEPVVALARSSLTDQIGRIPLLIISDRPFDSDPEDRIVHLDFPFDVDKLCRKVQDMLQDTWTDT